VVGTSPRLFAKFICYEGCRHTLGAFLVAWATRVAAAAAWKQPGGTSASARGSVRLRAELMSLALVVWVVARE